jgi:CubicO group peptidase (beta-lactamase class C family)
MSSVFGRVLVGLLVLVVAWIQSATARSADSDVGFKAVDEAIEQAIATRQTPGAVLLVGRGDHVVYRKAYGQRASVPRAEKMKLNTIFDLASLTKVIATAPSVLILVDEGKLQLDDPVARWIPEFGREGKERITIRQLLTHTSGLRGDVDLAEPWLGYDTAISLAAAETLQAAPGEKFIYSDIGFFLLAEIVARASGQPFERFVADRILKPLRMRDSMFKPPASIRARIAPTQLCTRYGWPCDGPDQILLRGIVHDPTARRMGGIAGHAGLFGTADDVARFAAMILNDGAAPRGRVLSSERIREMTSRATPPQMTAVRGLGWDIDTNYSAPRGEIFPIGSFGHTGWTGTSLWIDPANRVYVVLLTNRVHPNGGGDVRELRSRVGTLVAKALLLP